MTEEEKLIDFVEFLGERCSYTASKLKTRICRRAIRTINSWKGDMTIKGHTVHWSIKDCLRDGDYPHNFNFIDILSIQIQEYTYEEINPYLKDCIKAVLSNELTKVSASERVVLDYSVLPELDDYDEVYDEDKLIDSLLFCLQEILDEHWSTSKKIDKWSLKY